MYSYARMHARARTFRGTCQPVKAQRTIDKPSTMTTHHRSDAGNEWYGVRCALYTPKLTEQSAIMCQLAPGERTLCVRVCLQTNNMMEHERMAGSNARTHTHTHTHRHRHRHIEQLSECTFTSQCLSQVLNTKSATNLRVQ